MSINILRYSLFGIAGGQEVDHTFVKKHAYCYVTISVPLYFWLAILCLFKPYSVELEKFQFLVSFLPAWIAEKKILFALSLAGANNLC